MSSYHTTVTASFWGLFLACIAVTQWEINQLAVGYMVEREAKNTKPLCSQGESMHSKVDV